MLIVIVPSFVSLHGNNTPFEPHKVIIALFVPLHSKPSLFVTPKSNMPLCSTEIVHYFVPLPSNNTHFVSYKRHLCAHKTITPDTDQNCQVEQFWCRCYTCICMWPWCLLGYRPNMYLTKEHVREGRPQLSAKP